MAKFEINTYSDADEIIKTFTRNTCPVHLFTRAVKLAEKQEQKKASEYEVIDEIIEIVKTLFPEMTQEDVEKCDMTDIIFTFRQLVTKASGIESKN